MENEPRIAQIFKSINTGPLIELAAIIVGAVLLIVAMQQLLPRLAGHLHGRKRLSLLAVTPLVRLLVIIAAVVPSVPLLIEPSMQNMVALLGTVGLAPGFALKDYASSLIAGIGVIVTEKPRGTHYRLKAYPVDSARQFQFISDLTVRGKAALGKLDVEFITTPAMAQAPWRCGIYLF
jgi:hypothetical protein